MNIDKLCSAFEMEDSFTDEILNYDKLVDYEEIEDTLDLLFDCDTWDETLKKLQAYVGTDERGVKIVTLYMHGLLTTYDRYLQKGISETIFWDTVAFIPRFVKEHKAKHGYSAFTWAFWFPRQIAMCEFRIGEYEYELLEEDGVKKIYIHIPSDAKLRTGKIEEIYPFVEKFYPEYSHAEIYCNSWLLAPALAEILPEDSNILYFQRQFSVIEVEEDSPAFMDWIYPSRELPYEQLPERTALQRNVKKYLLSGKKVGWAYGKYIQRS